jgi:hypothetical protein
VPNDEATLAPEPAPSKPTVFLRKAAVKHRLGDISDDSLRRLERDDPLFPKPTVWRKQNIWPEEAIEAYVQHVLANSEPTHCPAGYPALARARARINGKPKPEPEPDLAPPRSGRPPGKSKRKEVAVAAGDD